MLFKCILTAFVSFHCVTADGGLDYHWDSCLKGYIHDNKVRAQAIL